MSATQVGAELLILSWTDVTDRFVTDRLLADSEQRYRLLAENSADVVCHLRDGKCVWISPSVEAVLGAPPESWLGRHAHDVVPPEDAAATRRRPRGFVRTTADAPSQR